MTTSLHFEAPMDLSIGRVRITSPEGTMADWIATPDTRGFSAPSVPPGFYSVEISPAGVTPQSAIFQVRPGIANSVAIPLFAALASTGSETSVLGEVDRKALDMALFGGGPPEEEDASVVSSPATFGERANALEPLEIPSDERRFTVALSQERADRQDGIVPFVGTAVPQLSGGQLQIEVRPERDWTPWNGERVWLSLSIERLRHERLLVPMHRAGTSITITPSPLASADVGVQVMPIDPRIRALARTLDAGSSDDAASVRETLLRAEQLDQLVGPDADDPWTAILAGLLATRFHEVFGSLEDRWTKALVRRAGWAFDAHVIRAQHLLFAAGASVAEQEAATTGAVTLLERAFAIGTPYYSYSNRLFAEMVAGLERFFEASELATRLPGSAERVRTLGHDSRQLSALRSSAGVAFSWLSPDEQSLREREGHVPQSNPSGRLGARDATVVMQGGIAAGRISFDTAPDRAPKSGLQKRDTTFERTGASDARPDSCPALDRNPGPRDDPNRSRFQGSDKKGGYALRARFGKEEHGSVSIGLTVEASLGSAVELGDVAWFCLHPTFSPQWVKVMFSGRNATLTVRSWGGFTVGV
ncbi:hypothetical protein IFT67_10945 [Sphingomonas sp. CFBP 13728]|uniref:pYEATS domain-containing protein n=1 Tax=Sphingomonas sp. CFBP 13728 TaxID=2775294 RepID=UPI0017824D08|nr:pYEATS domain-containing protein [Sphingomonas sp. CFBP 13728]MBD8619437.1 hypothetical protein [Sphingomonas sp. CFBP 13728]